MPPVLFGIDWGYFFPAVWRARFYQTAGEIMLASAFVGSLAYASARSVAFVVDGIREQPTLGALLDFPSGWKLGLFLVGWWTLGMLLYTACRIWKAEYESDVSEFLRAIKAHTIACGKVKCDGSKAFGAWGRALLKPTSPREWSHEIGMQVVFKSHLNHEEHLLDRPPVEGQAAARLHNAVAIFRELQAHSLVDRQTGATYEHPFDDTKFMLNEDGRAALRTAEHRGGAFVLKYRYIASDRAL